MLATTVEIFAADKSDPGLRIIEVPNISSVVFLDLAWGEGQPAEPVSFPVGEVLRRPRKSDELILTTPVGDQYVIAVNVAANDRALVIGIGSEGAAAAHEMTEWLTSSTGARIPREQVAVRVSRDQTTRLPGRGSPEQDRCAGGEWPTSCPWGTGNSEILRGSGGLCGACGQAVAGSLQGLWLGAHLAGE